MESEKSEDFQAIFQKKILQLEKKIAEFAHDSGSTNNAIDAQMDRKDDIQFIHKISFEIYSEIEN